MTAPVFEDVTIPRDSVPPVTDVEYPCEVCGNEAGPYVGRGRKPKYCPDHKRTVVAKRSTAPRATGTNDTLARQATEALCQINGFLTIGAMFAGMPATAGAIAGAEDGFREQTYTALLTDPDLCRSILKAGVKSGKIALVISYLMFGAAVVPTAALELKAKKEAREALKAQQESEQS